MLKTVLAALPANNAYLRAYPLSVARVWKEVGQFFRRGPFVQC